MIQPPLVPGLYEALVNQTIEREMQRLRQQNPEAVASSKLLREDIEEVLANYAADLVRAALASCREEDDYEDRARALINALAESAQRTTGEADFLPGAQLPPQGELQELWGVGDKIPAPKIERTELPAARTSVLTGGVSSGPHLQEEIKRELATADRAEWLVSFLRLSALTPLYDAIKAFTQRGGRLRVITTTYTGATEAQAVERLASIPGVEVHLQYEGTRCRHHAKVYVFHRATGFSTAYVGSSNFSRAALTTGLEWNVKIARAENPQAFSCVEEHFEGCWANLDDFERYTPGKDLQRLERALGYEKHPWGKNDEVKATVFAIRPYFFQEAVLEELSAARARHEEKALVVAATGTGKTAIAAFDFARFRRETGKKDAKILFLAHREEILIQALATYRGILEEQNFGELLVGGRMLTDRNAPAVFASVQSMNAQERLKEWAPDHFDVIVVDEAHHVTAGTYQRLLSWFHPKWLLGLTATPERADGSSVTDVFGGRIAAQIRLPEAVDKGLLAPFNYFVCTDPADLRGVSFHHGTYDDAELARLYTQGVMAQPRANAITKAITTYLPAGTDLRALAFCAGQEHARWMCDVFTQAGLRATVVTGETNAEERRALRANMEAGKIQIVCTVDVYNEGVDFPCINSLLFLRPTQSLTVYLQQLGRGLRRAPDKDACTVLDFVAPANRRFSFESRYRALMRDGSVGLRRQITAGFPGLPAGCTFTMEKVARESVLANIRENAEGLAALRRRMTWYLEEEAGEPHLAAFLSRVGITSTAFYRQAARVGGFLGLVHDVAPDRYPAVDLPQEMKKPEELALGLANWAQMEDQRWKAAMRQSLEARQMPQGDLAASWLRWAYCALLRTAPGSVDAAAAWWQEVLGNDGLRGELLELAACPDQQTSSDQPALDWGFACPLSLHGVYSRDAVLSALNPAYKGSHQSGVWHDDAHQLDVFFVTIHKSERWFAANVRYEDYAITDQIFHWQSQNTTAADSSTGRRYCQIHSFAPGEKRAVIFMRASKLLPGTNAAAPYVCLGFVRYRSHRGEKPMSMEWELQHPLTARLKAQAMVLSSG